jgi:hypothetical protein
MSPLRNLARCSLVLLSAAAACDYATVPAGGGDAVGTQVVITPGQVRLTAVGDTMRLRAALYDANGNRLPNAVTWTSADTAVFTIDQGGLVTGKQAQSVGRAIATVSGTADTAYVIVADPSASPCLGSAPPVALAVGQAVSVDVSNGACITSAGGGDEYVVVPWYGTGNRITIPIEVTGNGLSTPPSASLVAQTNRSLNVVRWPGGMQSLHRNLAFDRNLRQRGERLLRAAPKQRASLDRRALAPSLTIVPYLNIGDLIDLNTDIADCASTTYRTGRVVATSARAIVVADTSNPAGGFTDADYSRFATMYDTLVAAVEDAAFGAPTDIDANGKVVIFFTRAVNELTMAGATSYVSGFFHPRDLLPQTVNGYPYCPASNERELFYMPVPDPNGTINGNALTVGFVDSLTIPTLAHENQHLVNFGRRLYVNNALTDEEPWLNEGLSEVAQELVFYRATGLSPRQNIDATHFGTQPFDGLFAMFMAPTFARAGQFLQAPQSYSPYSSDDSLATYGAIWGFLRYAADQQGTSDGDVWLQLTNSQVSGFDNLFNVFGGNLPQMLQAWSVSLYTDDNAQGLDGTYTQPSWNFRSVYPAMPAGTSYPLLVTGLADGAPQVISLIGGGSAFFPFSIAGTEAAIHVTSNGWMPPATVFATIVRTR